MGPSQFPEWSKAPTMNFWQGDPPKFIPLVNWIRYPGNQTQYLTFALDATSVPFPTGVTFYGARNEYVTYPGSGGVNGTTNGIIFRCTDTRSGYRTKSPVSQVKIAGAIVLLPVQPASCTAIAKSVSEIEVSWTPGVGGSTPSTYRIYRSTSPTGPFVNYVTDTTSPFLNTGLAAGTNYHYCVAAQDAAGAVSSQSVVGSAMTFAGPPVTPVNVAAYAVDATTIRVSWTAGVGTPPADHFALYRATSASGPFSQISEPAYSPYDDTGHTQNQTFFYMVHAEDVSGVESADSAIVSATTLSNPVPAAPQGVTATALSTSTIRVAWQAVAGATSYRAYVRGSVGNPGAVFYDGALLTADHTLTASPSSNLTRYYDVSAVNAAGEGQRSVIVSATTLAFDGPAAPVNVQASTPDQGAIRLTWTPGTSGTPVVGYKVYRSSTSGGAATVIGTPTSPSFDDTGLPDGATRYYQITAVDAEPLESAKSVEVAVTTLAALTPNTPSSVTADALSQTEIRISWAAPSGGSTPVKYRVYRASASSGPFATFAADVVALSTIDAPLQANTKRWYQVSAIDANNAESSPSLTVNATTNAAPPVDEDIDIYVSASGSDSATGDSTTNALKTIQAALNKAQPGQTIGVMNGTYNVTTDIKSVRAGTSALPIRMKVVNGHAPVATGGTQTALMTISHPYNYYDGTGFEVRGNNSQSSANSASVNTSIFQNSKPDNGVRILTSNSQVKGFKIRNVKNNWVVVDAPVTRTHLVGLDCYVAGTMNKGDGQDAGNGIQIHDKGAKDLLIEQCRLASGGHDCLQSYGGPVLLRESLLTSNWESLWATGYGNRIWTFRDNGIRTVIEDSVLHTSLLTVENPQSQAMQKMVNANMLMKRVFQMYHRATGGSQIALLSPPPGEGNPTASDQRYAHVTVHDGTGAAIASIDNAGDNGYLAPFYFTNCIISANSGARAIDLSYRSTASGVRGNWRQLFFFRKCGFEANYTIRVRDLAGVQSTITKTVTQMVTDEPANFAPEGDACFVAAPAYVSTSLPASTVPLTALAQTRANFLPTNAAYLGTGAHLTRVNGAKTSQATITLDDAKWFRDQMGWTHLAGDTIYIEGVGARTITLIAGNQVTLNNVVTVADNAKVWLGSSATPNVGAA